MHRPFTTARPSLRTRTIARSHTVVLEHEGKTHELSVPDGSTILDVALDKGIDLPYDCKLGVCMTCPAKLVSVALVAHRALPCYTVAVAGTAAVPLQKQGQHPALPCA